MNEVLKIILVMVFAISLIVGGVIGFDLNKDNVLVLFFFGMISFGVMLLGVMGWTLVRNKSLEESTNE